MAWLLALIVLAWARWSGKPFAAFGLVAVVTGLVFALIYVWRKEVWTVMAVHAGFDLAAITMIYAGREDQIAHWLFR